MDDAARVSMREAVQHLRGRLDDLTFSQLTAAERLSERAPGYVLVGDVDVGAVGGERMRALAALVPEPRRRDRLTLRARAGLALARDDLERDLDACLLVAS
jgi:hypothetical protein